MVRVKVRTLFERRLRVKVRVRVRTTYAALGLPKI